MRIQSLKEVAWQAIPQRETSPEAERVPDATGSTYRPGEMIGAVRKQLDKTGDLTARRALNAYLLQVAGDPSDTLPLTLASEGPRLAGLYDDLGTRAGLSESQLATARGAIQDLAIALFGDGAADLFTPEAIRRRSTVGRGLHLVNLPQGKESAPQTPVAPPTPTRQQTTAFVGGELDRKILLGQGDPERVLRKYLAHLQKPGPPLDPVKEGQAIAAITQVAIDALAGKPDKQQQVLAAMRDVASFVGLQLRYGLNKVDARPITPPAPKASPSPVTRLEVGCPTLVPRPVTKTPALATEPKRNIGPPTYVSPAMVCGTAFGAGVARWLTDKWRPPVPHYVEYLDGVTPGLGAAFASKIQSVSQMVGEAIRKAVSVDGMTITYLNEAPFQIPQAQVATLVAVFGSPEVNQAAFRFGFPTVNTLFMLALFQPKLVDALIGTEPALAAVLQVAQGYALFSNAAYPDPLGVPPDLAESFMATAAARPDILALKTKATDYEATAQAQALREQVIKRNGYFGGQTLMSPTDNSGVAPDAGTAVLDLVVARRIQPVVVEVKTQVASTVVAGDGKVGHPQLASTLLPEHVDDVAHTVLAMALAAATTMGNNGHRGASLRALAAVTSGNTASLAGLLRNARKDPEMIPSLKALTAVATGTRVMVARIVVPLVESQHPTPPLFGLAASPERIAEAPVHYSVDVVPPDVLGRAIAASSHNIANKIGQQRAMQNEVAQIAAISQETNQDRWAEGSQLVYGSDENI